MRRQALGLALCVGCLALTAVARAEEAPPPLTLEEAVRIGQEQHLAVLLAALQVDSSKAGLRIAQSGKLPVITGTSSYSASKSAGSRTTLIGPTPITSPADQTQDILSSNVSLRHTFYNGGLTAAQLKQAEAQVRSSTFGYDAAKQDVTLGVIVAYFSYLEAIKLHSVTREQVTAAQRHLEATQASINAGVLAPADIYQFRARLADAQIAEIQARNAEQQSATALRQAMGLELGPPLVVMDTERLTDDGLGSTAVPELVSRSLARRPELLEARESTLIAVQGRRISYINASPRVSLTGQASWQPGQEVSTTPPGGPTAVSTSFGHDYGATVSLTVPIWDFGASRAQKKQADVSLASARLREQQLERDTAASVEVAYLALVNAREQVGAATASAEQSRVALDAAEARYQLGLATPLELIDAQVTYFNSQVVQVRAQYTEQLALARLARILGETERVLEPSESTGK